MDRRLLRRRVSIDFTVPARASSRWDRLQRGRSFVPVSAIGKWPPLLNFDLRDHAGSPMPLLTAAENAAVDEAALLGVADRLDGTDSALPAHVHLVTHGTRRDAISAAHEVHRQIACIDSTNGIRDRFRDLVYLLAQYSLLWVPVSQSAGSRLIIKFAYDEPSQLARGIRLIRLFTGRRNRYYLMPHIGHAGSYHLEIHVPEVVTVNSAKLFVPSEESDALVEASPPPAWALDAHSEIADRRVHLYLGRRRREAGGGLLLLRTAIARRGTIWAAWITAVAITALLGFYWLDASAIVKVNAAAITTLLLVPTLLGYLIVKPNEHPMTREHLRWVRAAVVVAGALPILAAVVLVGAGKHPAPSAVDYLWRDLAIAGAAITGLLTVTLLAAASTNPARSHG
jgi:hypothetical protein